MVYSSKILLVSMSVNPLIILKTLSIMSCQLVEVSRLFSLD